MAKAKIVKSNKEKAIAVAQSYLRASLASVLALYLAGQTDWKVLANAFLAGLVGPVLKALDPKSTEFGKNSK
jgi:hypothetical protein